MTNQAQPFFPLLEPKEAAKAREAAAKRIIETKRLAWRVFMKRVSGLHEMPPRQRFALYVAIEQRPAVIEIGGFPVFLKLLERINAEEALWIARDYRRQQIEYAKEAKRNGNREAVYA